MKHIVLGNIIYKLTDKQCQELWDAQERLIPDSAYDDEKLFHDFIQSKISSYKKVDIIWFNFWF